MPGPQLLTAVELFCGAGGMALGVARAGFRTIAAIDFDDLACETLRMNKRRGVAPVTDWNVIEQKVSSIDFAVYEGRIDLVSGGPPCQPFSQAGRNTGRKDRRDGFPDMIAAVRQIRPKAFALENVPGILRAGNLDYFNYILLQLQYPTVVRRHRETWKAHRARLERIYTSGENVDVHYKVIHQRLQATDFGIPQRRERVFIVGIRYDLGVSYSFPLPTHSREALLWTQFRKEDYWERHQIPTQARKKLKEQILSHVTKLPEIEPTLAPWRTVRDAISDLSEPAAKNSENELEGHFINPGARAYPGHTGSLLDCPSKTLKAGQHGVPGGENTLCLNDGSVRYFTVRECARLQTFPDQWYFCGAWTRKMRQLGNAVPVDLA